MKQLRSLLACAIVAAVVLGCSGGSASGRIPSPNCNGPTKFCLTTCNLGCSTNGSCAVTEIAQNQPIVLRFSQNVDPRSVSNATVSIKTASGQTPDGSLLINGNEIRFQPEVRISGGITRFGFLAGQTYVFSLPAGIAGATLRADSGAPLSTPVSCTLSVTQGLVDLDGQPPVGTLKTPALPPPPETVAREVPRDTPIIVEFSELIDISAFQGQSTLTSPIIYRLRGTRRDQSGALVCDPDFEPILIDGVPIASVDPVTQKTEITLQPGFLLPRQSCVEVRVTDQVRDLSGKAAIESSFTFFTEVGVPEPGVVKETFTNGRKLDRDISAGEWTGGRGLPGLLGGSGLMGSFDANIGEPVSGQPGTVIWRTDNFVIPATHTLLGESIPVADGQFEFTDLVILEGQKVIIRGSKPAIIRVRGRVQIDGELSVDGQSPNPFFSGGSILSGGSWGPNPGEGRTVGGAGGGHGGKGARSCSGDGPGAFDGEDGATLVAPASSGYAGGVSGTGGHGGVLFPATGLDGDVAFRLFNFLSCQAAGGGGGGAFLGAAEPGRVEQTFLQNPADEGPDADPGSRVGFLLPAPGVSSLDHFLVGGSGGGGGGSQPLNLSTTDIQRTGKTWNGGAAGAGGGGALALRVGGAFAVDSLGVLSSRGGGGNLVTDGNFGPPSPGGAGSGGSILLQLERTIRQRGLLDVSGGDENQVLYQSNIGGVPADLRGGKGGHGYVRMESPVPINENQLGNVEGPPSVSAQNFGLLTDSDTRTGFASLFYSTGQVVVPRYTHYVLTASIDGQEVVFSDAEGGNPANVAGQPVRVFIQGGPVSTSSQLQGDPGPWRDFANADRGASINDDDATGLRFMMLFDRTTATDIQILQFEVHFES